MQDEFDFEVTFSGKGIWRIQQVTLGSGPLGAHLCELLGVVPGKITMLQVSESCGVYELRYYAGHIGFLVAEVHEAVIQEGKCKAIRYRFVERIGQFSEMRHVKN